MSDEKTVEPGQTPTTPAVDEGKEMHRNTVAGQMLDYATYGGYSAYKRVKEAGATVPAMNGRKKRDKTLGEQVFDYFTYGGFTLIGNEWLSTVIMGHVLRDKDGKETRFTKLYEKSQAFFSKHLSFIKSDYIHKDGMFNYILWACIGGMFLVPPVKLLEDNKGTIVRKLDDVLHGNNSDSDPKLASAHKEMDDAPHQSWVSLGQGRIFVVVFAQIVHFLIGWPKAISGILADKFFPGSDKASTLVRDNATYERATLGFARWVGKTFDKEHRGEIEKVLKGATDTESRYTRHAQEGKLVQNTNIASSFLVLSGSLTILFYIMSKAFAKTHEEKMEKRAERKLDKLQLQEAKTEHTAGSKLDQLHQEEAKAERKLDKLRHKGQDADQLDATINLTTADRRQVPATRIAQVENLSRMEAPAQLQLNGGGA